MAADHFVLIGASSRVSHSRTRTLHGLVCVSSVRGTMDSRSSSTGATAFRVELWLAKAESQSFGLLSCRRYLGPWEVQLAATLAVSSCTSTTTADHTNFTSPPVSRVFGPRCAAGDSPPRCCSHTWAVGKPVVQSSPPRRPVLTAPKRAPEPWAHRQRITEQRAR